MEAQRMRAAALAGALLVSSISGIAQNAAPGRSGDRGGGMTSDSAGTTMVTAPLVVLVPEETARNPELYNGCWVQLKDKEAMPGKGSDLLTIVGAMHLPELKTASGINWARKADSMTIGPKAKVTIYADAHYQGASARLRAGQEVQDLNKQLGFAKSIDSMQVECTG